MIKKFGNTDFVYRNCEDEKIHLNGKIQNRGYLFSVNVSNSNLMHISENFISDLKLNNSDILKKNISTLNSFLIFDDKSLFTDYYASLFFQKSNTNCTVSLNGNKFYLIQHAVKYGLIIFEMEPVIDHRDYTQDTLQFINSLMYLDNEISILNSTVSYLKEMLGMDRVMIYKFCPDKSGEVVAEAKNKYLDSFLHLRYPESDIPTQARILYSKTKFRSLSNVYGKNINIISIEENILDLTYCTLRALSPTHITYLKNMKVGASYSVSIMNNGELWGLISCHSLQAKQLDFKMCHLSHLISNVLISSIVQKQNEATKKISIGFSKELVAFQNVIHNAKNSFKSLYKNFSKMQGFSNADGVAFYYEGRISTSGICPSRNQIKNLIEYFNSREFPEKFYTNEIDSKIENFQCTEIGGVYIRKISNFQLYILWFKKKHPYEIQWAGDPNEKAIGLVEDNKIKPIYGFQPRKSFLIFRQSIENKSQSWLSAEKKSIENASNFLTNILTRDFKSQIEFEKEIETLKKEKDFFSYTISHDLKTPLSVISTYTDLLKYYISKEQTREHEVMSKITESIQRMSSMIDGIKEISNIENNQFDFEEIDMDNLIETIVQDLTVSKYSKKIKFTMLGNKKLIGNYHLIYHCFYNVLSNAFKYSSLKENPEVNFNFFTSQKKISYCIRDNGVGIPLHNHKEIFDIFNRADNVSEFEGSGIGLSIVKKIIQKHSGSIRFVCGENSGTCFYLTFPNIKCKD